MENDTKRPATLPSAHEANRRLAGLLGWTSITELGNVLVGTKPGGIGPEPLPDWTGDWRDCGPLMVEHIRRMRLWPHRGIVGTTPSDPQEYDLVRDKEKGESRDEATRRLIVDAVILQLEAGR